MTIRIGAYFFDDYQGEIRYPRKRVESFARTDKAGVGIQVLPTSTEPFQIRTFWYDTPANVDVRMKEYDALIGTDVAIITESITYQIDMSTIFTVEDVVHAQEAKHVRARGERNGSIVEHSPAALIRSTWTLRGGPSS